MLSVIGRERGTSGGVAGRRVRNCAHSVQRSARAGNTARWYRAGPTPVCGFQTAISKSSPAVSFHRYSAIITAKAAHGDFRVRPTFDV